MAVYALISGINYYADPANRLNGCINDMLDYEAQLLKYGVPSENIVRMSDDPARKDVYPSKANFNAELDKLRAKVKAGDTVFISYSGHGTNTRDVGKNETDGKAEAIYTADGQLMTDDEFYTRVARFPKGAKALVVLDCCHSASGLDLRNGITKIETKRPDNKEHGYVVMLSGCQDNQTSADFLASRDAKELTREFKMNDKGVRRYRGALTASLMDTIDKIGLKAVLDTALSGSLTLMRSLNRKLVTWLEKNGFDQKPNMAFEGALPTQVVRGEITHALNNGRYALRVTKARAENYVGGKALLKQKEEALAAQHEASHERSAQRRARRA